MDTTEICTVVNNDDRENGHYQISIDGSVIFDAYSEKTTFIKDEQVVVLFPKDDTIKKTILGDRKSVV